MNATMALFVMSIFVIFQCVNVSGGENQDNHSPVSSSTSFVHAKLSANDGTTAGKLAGDARTTFLAWSRMVYKQHLPDPVVSVSELLRRHPVPFPSFGVSERCRLDLRQLYVWLLGEYRVRSRSWLDDWSTRVLRAIVSNSSEEIARSLIVWPGNFAQCVELIFSGSPTHSYGNSGGQFCSLIDKKSNWPSPYTPSTVTCLPGSCTYTEKQLFLDYMTAPNYTLKVALHKCRQINGTPFDATAIVISAALSLLILFAVIGTFLDVNSWRLAQCYHTNWAEIEERYSLHFLLMFSVRRSWRSILDNTKNPRNKFQFIEGIRFLSLLWIMSRHVLLPIPGSTTKEALSMTSPFTFTLHKAVYAVDTFFYLSGFCAVYFYLQSKPKCSIPLTEIPKLYLKRYIRLTPAFACAVAFVAGPLMVLGNGPFWSNIVNQTFKCRKSCWKNLLYFQNFYDRYDFCIVSTWYLMADMQMYLLVPPTLVLFSRKPRWSIMTTCMLLIATELCVGVHYWTTDFETSENQRSYFLPWIRATPYFVGMLTGYLLQVTPIHSIRLRPLFLRIGWAICVMANIILVYWDLPLYWMRISLTKELHVFIKTTKNLLWSMTMVWITLACSTGNGGFINDFLSCDIFGSLGRLTYCLFLTHTTVQIIYSGNLQATVPYTDSYATIVILGTTLASMVAATVLYMLVEFPMSYFKFSPSSGKKKDENNVSKQIELRMIENENKKSKKG